MMNFISTLAATLAGIAATWFFAWWFYLRSGEQLRQEAEELRRITTLILHALHHAGLADVKWDPNGKAIGINITLQAGTPGVRLEAPHATIVATGPTDSH